MKPARAWAAGATIAFTILAPAMGGSTALWAQGVLALGTGLLLVLCPPRKSLGLMPNLLLGFLFLVALTAFLPAEWLTQPQWRNDLAQLGAQLPATRSPQPWLSFQWTGLLLVGLTWTYYLIALPWSERVRGFSLETFAIGILVLAATLIVGFVSQSRVPFWPSVPEFGFFPNRNQTSNVLGLGGVMIYALGLQHFVEGRKYWSLWLIGLAVICWALIINQSRSGILLFFFGALTLHLYFWKGMGQRRRPVIALGGLTVLIALFLINGGATLARFGKETAQFFPENLRWSFYRDALNLVAKSSLFGNGLGNFRALFVFSRFDSMTASEAAHPESDWLWAAVDLGWPAVLAIVVLLIWWIRRCLPFDAGTGRLLRVAGLICGCGFALHGIFDVSGHRPGALWPALFLGSIAIHPETIFKRSAWVPSAFRLFGIALILIGLWWISSVFGETILPTAATQDQIQNEIMSALDHDNYAAVAPLAKRGLQIAPLDWLVYYKRGVAEIALAHPRELAVRDFRIANYLYPLWPDLGFHEGQAWLGVGEVDLAIEAWTEALRRARDRAPNFYADMVRSVKGDPVMLDRVRQLADDNQALLIIFLRVAGPFEFRIEADRLIGEDRPLRSFSPEELEQFFTEWYEKGDKLELAQLLQQHPEWKKIGWRHLARTYADYEDYRQACETMQEFATPPRLPQANSDEPIEKLGARFQSDRTNVRDGLALYFTQLKQGQKTAARGTLSQLAALSNSPKYLWYLEAQSRMEENDWPKAWNAWVHYEFGEN